MTKRQQTFLWLAALACLLGMVAALVHHFSRRKPLWLKGAITTHSQDPQKQAPVANAEISVESSAGTVNTTSDPHGFFTLQLPISVRRGRPITIHASHPGYKLLEAKDYVTDKLYILQVVPAAEGVASTVHRPATTVDNLRVRYSIKAMTAVNIGSAVKVFEVQNTGNVPCKGQHPCSPDGLWKAAIGSMSLDAGVGNEFRNARVSCIAGPCPFTKIEKDGFSRDGQKISVSVRGWSDTTTFLLEAEVFHPTVSDVVHESHPVIFGRALNFTLPATAEGVSIQADVGGETIVFPLGPALFLSWAKCEASVGTNETKIYRCELKPDYQFPETSTERD